MPVLIGHGAPRRAQAPPDDQVVAPLLAPEAKLAGDTVSDAEAGLPAQLSPAVTRKDLARAMNLLADWQLTRLPTDRAEIRWTFAALRYDQDKHLFTRYAMYLDKHEANRQKIFWARGNGWVMAGLVPVVERLPANSPLGPKYAQQQSKMAAAIAAVQRPDGLWRSGLLDLGHVQAAGGFGQRVHHVCDDNEGVDVGCVGLRGLGRVGGASCGPAHPNRQRCRDGNADNGRDGHARRAADAGGQRLRLDDR